MRPPQRFMIRSDAAGARSAGGAAIAWQYCEIRHYTSTFRGAPSSDSGPGGRTCMVVLEDASTTRTHTLHKPSPFEEHLTNISRVGRGRDSFPNFHFQFAITVNANVRQ